MSKWEVEPWDRYDKRVRIKGPLWLEVDNDDVDTHATEYLIPRLADCLNAHWQPLYRNRCTNEDCANFWDVWFPTTPGYEICDECGKDFETFEVTAS